MAGGAIVNTAGGKDYPGKLTLFVFFTCVVAATGGLIFGYDIGISGQLLLPLSHLHRPSSLVLDHLHDDNN
jgi:hypothetical protein